MFDVFMARPHCIAPARCDTCLLTDHTNFLVLFFFFFYNDPPPPTLSPLPHPAPLPISPPPPAIFLIRLQKNLEITGGHCPHRSGRTGATQATLPVMLREMRSKNYGALLDTTSA